MESISYSYFTFIRRNVVIYEIAKLVNICNKPVESKKGDKEEADILSKVRKQVFNKWSSIKSEKQVKYLNVKGVIKVVGYVLPICSYT